MIAGDSFKKSRKIILVVDWFAPEFYLNFCPRLPVRALGLAIEIEGNEYKPAESHRCQANTSAPVTGMPRRGKIH
jgi:hypothetical protein